MRPSVSILTSLVLSLTLQVAPARADDIYTTLLNGAVLRVRPGQGLSTYASVPPTCEGLTFDASGNLFVASSIYVYEVKPSDHRPTQFANYSPGDPQALVMGPDGDLYLAINGVQNNGANGAILRITPDHAVSRFANVIGPVGLAFDGHGNLFASDKIGGKINEITPDGTVSTFVAGLGSNNPSDVAFDRNGNLYVAMLSDGTIDKITPSGSVSTFASGFYLPEHLAFDTTGNLYVTNDVIASGQLSTVITRITPDGTASTWATADGATWLAVPEPKSVWVCYLAAALGFRRRPRLER